MILWLYLEVHKRHLRCILKAERYLEYWDISYQCTVCLCQRLSYTHYFQVPGWLCFFLPLDFLDMQCNWPDQIPPLFLVLQRAAMPSSAGKLFLCCYFCIIFNRQHGEHLYGMKKKGYLWDDSRKRNCLRSSEISPCTCRSELIWRLWEALHFSRKPLTTWPRVVKMSSFSLPKLPHLSQLLSWVWDFFWHWARLAAEHTHPGVQAARRLAAQPLQPGRSCGLSRPLCCIGLSEQPILTLQGPGEQPGPHRTAL